MSPPSVMKQRTALISAYDKNGVASFARELVELGWSILASSGTARHLAEQGVPVVDVATLLGPPILNHRVVTLSQGIHAGLLARDTLEDDRELLRIKFPRIDLVYINLYPLVDEVARSGRDLNSVIEKTDIGGPAILRAAAKGRRLALCRQSQVAPVIQYLAAGYLGKGDEYAERFISALSATMSGDLIGYEQASYSFHADYAGGEFMEMVA